MIVDFVVMNDKHTLTEMVFIIYLFIYFNNVI